MTLGYDERGKRRRQVVYGERQSDVIAKLRKVQRQVDDGLPTPDSRVTVAQLLDRWYQDVLRLQVAPSALDNYRAIADRHIRTWLGRVRMTQLTPADVDALWAAKIDALPVCQRTARPPCRRTPVLPVGGQQNSMPADS